MSTQTIQMYSVTDEEIARGIAAGRRLRALAVRSALQSAFAAVSKPVGSLFSGTKSADTGGAHAAAV
ncbi:MAG: hypothetical protein NXI18_00745 [Alphaproteobacteria bacterium]|nr:hypothetical protein [Alphaproteobacteria bacterium]